MIQPGNSGLRCTLWKHLFYLYRCKFACIGVGMHHISFQVKTLCSIKRFVRRRHVLLWKTPHYVVAKFHSSKQWRLFIFILRESKWGTLKNAGNPRCAVPAESHSICTDRRRPGPAAGLQVSPTSDTCQSVAILMNRPHCLMINLETWTNNIRCLFFLCDRKSF